MHKDDIRTLSSITPTASTRPLLMYKPLPAEGTASAQGTQARRISSHYVVNHGLQLISKPALKDGPGVDESLALGYPFLTFDCSLIVQADSFDWLACIPEANLSGVVTDPPYSVKDFEESQLAMNALGCGGTWRYPPIFDGANRQALPRFTALSQLERKRLFEYYYELTKLLCVALKPGAHVFLAANSFLSQIVFEAIASGGLEYRGTINRMVGTLRGGDRPKNAETEFPEVCTLPRGGYEPWGLFRNPLPARMTVADCLKRFGTGGLRRFPNGNPFCDVIPSGRTSQAERAIANHPSLKPQEFLRQLTWAVLPLGQGIVADPFMGSGSTVAAAEAIGVRAIGVERHEPFYKMAVDAIALLSSLSTNLQGFSCNEQALRAS